MPVPVAETLPTVGARVPDSSTTPSLSVLVVRLLALALDISGGWSPAPPAAALPIPAAYRDWPSLASSVESKLGRQRLRFYVCPNALLTTDDASFPVGTVFVVESEPGSRMAKKLSGPLSLFVMEKYAGVSVDGPVASRRESWIYASYGSDGRLVTADSTRCGVCRLPLTSVSYQ
ncbi:MAG: hypothetical protein HY348_08730 [Nitrospira defluvii]|nr:hypothetical protein [Nitrospira defluvii]